MTNNEPQLWQYQCRVTDVVDGDTLDLTVDLGFGTHKTGSEARVRLDGVDTHETYGVPKESEEYQRGSEQHWFVKRWVKAGRRDHDGDWPFLVSTRKGDERGKFGRYLAEVVRRSDGARLTEDLVESFPEVER